MGVLRAYGSRGCPSRCPIGRACFNPGGSIIDTAAYRRTHSSAYYRPGNNPYRYPSFELRHRTLRCKNLFYMRIFYDIKVFRLFYFSIEIQVVRKTWVTIWVYIPYHEQVPNLFQYHFTLESRHPYSIISYWTRLTTACHLPDCSFLKYAIPSPSLIANTTHHKASQIVTH
ncbi:MAG: hypothetical protein BECKG1743D_GA0114223_111913 [Candidatus Kentron sp. G]|nr:MAG: hypothetical protein BECKG1743F_GA0114225_111811 [Candidatus Kentron sp. G]VFN07309.1 MAG: hypothetical protein BECKG1743E_GA0114224_111803 [Candidatus Kentron sp. G]VFN07915.1 MAG: hypothetical protein BECKG1743D_GA0114223_111913 [Candidatus Kentron sp. G]